MSHSIVGWWIIWSYYLCSFVCLVKAMLSRISARPFFRFWVMLGIVLFALGVDRQFNLLSAATGAGRIVFTRLNWMEYHRTFQAAVMAIAFITGSLFFIGLYSRKMRALQPTRKFIAIGVIYLSFFVVERSISLHQFHSLLSYTIAGVRVNWIAELAGICWVLFWIILDSLSRQKTECFR